MSFARWARGAKRASKVCGRVVISIFEKHLQGSFESVARASKAKNHAKFKRVSDDLAF